MRCVDEHDYHITKRYSVYFFFYTCVIGFIIMNNHLLKAFR